MFHIISDPTKLQRYQDMFMEQMASTSTHILPCRISWRPSHIDVDIHWSSNLNLWWYSRIVPESKVHASKYRWWNVFGIGQPFPYQTLHIDCEINIPTTGINRKVAGAFIENSSNCVLLAYRGNNWGGGKYGCTKAFFWKNYHGHLENATDGSTVNRFAIISKLGNQNLPYEVSHFVNWIYNIKKIV